MGWIVFLVIVGGLLLAAKIAMDRKKEEEAEQQRRKEEVLEAAERAQRFLEKVDSVKSNTAKANNCQKAAQELNKIEHLPEARALITDYNQLRKRLEALQKVLPIIGYIEKAYRHQFKGSERAEKNALLDALYDMDTKGVTDEDFSRAEAYPEGTGEIIERKNIEKRLRELGWEG